MNQTQRAPRTRDAEASGRKKRQGSETRSMCRTLQIRYDPGKLEDLQAVAGRSLPTLLRLYGDFLTELLPVAQQRGLDPVELIRDAAISLLEAPELLSA